MPSDPNEDPTCITCGHFIDWHIRNKAGEYKCQGRGCHCVFDPLTGFGREIGESDVR